MGSAPDLGRADCVHVLPALARTHPPLIRQRPIFVGERVRPPIGRYVKNQERQDAHISEWLTVQQVCERAHMSRSYLYGQWADGTGPRYSEGSQRLVLASWLDDWLLSREVAA